MNLEMLNTQLNTYYEQWKAGQISDAQMAVNYFVFKYATHRQEKLLLRYLESNSAEAALFKFQFKKIKLKAIDCLIKWYAGEWNLILADKIFTPMEVLGFQADGIRPVTMLFHREDEQGVLHRKSPLDFLVHDLEHGYMFFHDRDLMNMQKKFFQRMQQSLARGDWNIYLENKDFLDKFNYVISDMNTHEEHYRAFLASMIPENEGHKITSLFN